jgi:hypothetical protein
VELDLSDKLIDCSIARAPSGHNVKLKISLTTVDEFVEQEKLPRVDFIKMDIEGAEEPALRGAMRTINRFRPKWSIASYHLDFAGEPQHPKLVRLLKESGYRVEEVEQQRIYAW